MGDPLAGPGVTPVPQVILWQEARSFYWSTGAVSLSNPQSTGDGTTLVTSRGVCLPGAGHSYLQPRLVALQFSPLWSE